MARSDHPSDPASGNDPLPRPGPDLAPALERDRGELPDENAILSWTESEFLDYWRDEPEDLANRAAILRCRRDLDFFARFFFPGHCPLAFSPLHQHLIRRRLERCSTDPSARRGSFEMSLAPRGAAKSTLVSLVFPLHGMLYGLERYVVLVSATQRQASMRIQDLRGQLIGNERLRRVFAATLARGAGGGGRSIRVGDARMDAFSAGTEMRGVSHAGWRPTWIVLDDVESSSRVESRAYRDRLSDWLREVVENLGAGYTNVDVVGTMLHRDALPARVLTRPDVGARVFRSILRESDRPELWDRWRDLLSDLSDPHRTTRARIFFEANRVEMLAGARALWDAREPYYDLQLMRASLGETAFDKEKQNRPGEGERAMLPVALAPRLRVRDRRIVVLPPPEGGLLSSSPAPPESSLDALRIFGFLDPSLGGGRANARGDFAAIAVVGVDRAGYLHALDAWLDRAGPSVQIARVFQMHERWGFELFGVETNAFQELLLEPVERERERRRAAGGTWDLPIRGVAHRTSKRARILSLEPLLRNGWLLLAETLPEEFVRQIEDFPQDPHDDAPDALQAAVELARGATSRTDRLERVPGRADRGSPGARGF